MASGPPVFRSGPLGLASLACVFGVRGPGLLALFLFPWFLGGPSGPFVGFPPGSVGSRRVPPGLWTSLVHGLGGPGAPAPWPLGLAVRLFCLPALWAAFWACFGPSPSGAVGVSLFSAWPVDLSGPRARVVGPRSRWVGLALRGVVGRLPGWVPSFGALVRVGGWLRAVQGRLPSIARLPCRRFSPWQVLWLKLHTCPLDFIVLIFTTGTRWWRLAEGCRRCPGCF